MPRKRRQPAQRLATQAFELAVTAPQVAGLRIARMAAAGSTPSARDQAELVRMGSEKVFAFYQSWSSIWTAAWTSQLQFAQAMSTATFAAMQDRRATLPDPASAALAGTRMFAAAIAPVHRRTMANAKRLSRRTKHR